jgi:hypothetical protein
LRCQKEDTVASPFAENDVHKALYAKGGLETFVQDSPEIEQALAEAEYKPITVRFSSFPAWALVSG